MIGLLRDRDFALLWAGQSVSQLGTAVTYLAFPLVAVVALDASAFQVSLVAAASTAAWLVVGLPAGAWVDRAPGRPLLIGADLGRAVLIAAVPAAWALDVLTLGYLALVAFAVGVLTVIFDVGYPAFLPSVVSRERLVDGNGALAASESAATIAGPGLGGLLVQAAGAPFALLADALSFLVSAAGLAAMRTRTPPRPRRPARRRLSQEIIVGLRHVRSHTLVRTIAVTSALANFVFGGYEAVLLVFLARQVGLSPALIGGLLALSSTGGLLGAVVAAPLSRWAGDARVLSGAALAMAAAGLVIPLTGKGGNLLWYVAGAFVLTLGAAVFNVCARAAIQVATPEAVLGRVSASVRLLGRVTMPLGAVAAGTVAGVSTPRTALVIFMVLLAVVPAWLLVSPLGRQVDDSESGQDSEQIDGHLDGRHTGR